MEELGKETKIGTKTRHSSFSKFSDLVLETSICLAKQNILGRF